MPIILASNQPAPTPPEGELVTVEKTVAEAPLSAGEMAPYLPRLVTAKEYIGGRLVREETYYEPSPAIRELIEPTPPPEVPKAPFVIRGVVPPKEIPEIPTEKETQTAIAIARGVTKTLEALEKSIEKVSPETERRERLVEQYRKVAALQSQVVPYAQKIAERFHEVKLQEFESGLKSIVGDKPYIPTIMANVRYILQTAPPEKAEEEIRKYFDQWEKTGILKRDTFEMSVKRFIKQHNIPEPYRNEIESLANPYKYPGATLEEKIKRAAEEVNRYLTTTHYAWRMERREHPLVAIPGIVGQQLVAGIERIFSVRKWEHMTPQEVLGIKELFAPPAETLVEGEKIIQKEEKKVLPAIRVGVAASPLWLGLRLYAMPIEMATVMVGAAAGVKAIGAMAKAYTGALRRVILALPAKAQLRAIETFARAAEIGRATKGAFLTGMRESYRHIARGAELIGREVGRAYVVPYGLGVGAKIGVYGAIAATAAQQTMATIQSTRDMSEMMVRGALTAGAIAGGLWAVRKGIELGLTARPIGIQAIPREPIIVVEKGRVRFIPRIWMFRIGARPVITYVPEQRIYLGARGKVLPTHLLRYYATRPEILTGQYISPLESKAAIEIVKRTVLPGLPKDSVRRYLTSLAFERGNYKIVNLGKVSEKDLRLQIKAMFEDYRLGKHFNAFWKEFRNQAKNIRELYGSTSIFTQMRAVERLPGVTKEELGLLKKVIPQKFLRVNDIDLVVRGTIVNAEKFVRQISKTIPNSQIRWTERGNPGLFVRIPEGEWIKVLEAHPSVAPYYEPPYAELGMKLWGETFKVGRFTLSTLRVESARQLRMALRVQPVRPGVFTVAPVEKDIKRLYRWIEIGAGKTVKEAARLAKLPHAQEAIKEKYQKFAEVVREWRKAGFRLPEIRVAVRAIEPPKLPIPYVSPKVVKPTVYYPRLDVFSPMPHVMSQIRGGASLIASKYMSSVLKQSYSVSASVASSYALASKAASITSRSVSRSAVSISKSVSASVSSFGASISASVSSAGYSSSVSYYHGAASTVYSTLKGIESAMTSIRSAQKNVAKEIGWWRFFPIEIPKLVARGRAK